MSTQGTPGRRRLILCGICFLESCPFSKWIDEDGSLDVLDEIEQLWLAEQHEKLSIWETTQRDRNQQLEAIETEVQRLANESGDTIEVFAQLMDGTSIDIEYKPVETVKDLSVDDILKKYQEHLPNDKGENDKTREA